MRYMRFARPLSIWFLVMLPAVIGCQETAGTNKPVAPTSAPPATTPAPAAPPPAPSAASTITSDEDYVAKATLTVDQVIAVFKASGTDCHKLAEALTKFAADNDALVKALNSYEKAHPEAERKFDEASKPKLAEFEGTAGPAITACKDDKAVGDAMAKLSGE
jgi:hypothetical protein